MVRFRIVGRREEPATVQVPAASGPGTTTQQITSTVLLVQPVDENGEPYKNTAGAATAGVGQTFAIPVDSLAAVADMPTGALYALTPVL